MLENMRYASHHSASHSKSVPTQSLTSSSMSTMIHKIMFLILIILIVNLKPFHLEFYLQIKARLLIRISEETWEGFY